MIVMGMALGWLLISVAVGLVVGTAIRLDDQRAAAADLTVEDVLGRHPTAT